MSFVSTLTTHHRLGFTNINTLFNSFTQHLRIQRRVLLRFHGRGPERVCSFPQKFSTFDACVSQSGCPVTPWAASASQWNHTFCFYSIKDLGLKEYGRNMEPIPVRLELVIMTQSTRSVEHLFSSVHWCDVYVRIRHFPLVEWCHKFSLNFVSVFVAVRSGPSNKSS